MIQRIQTLYLFLAAIAALMLMFLPIGTLQPVTGMTELPESADMAEDNLSVIKIFARNYIGLMVGALVMVSTALLSIFLYSNRPLQTRIGWLSVVGGLVFAGIFVSLFSDKLAAFMPVAGSFMVPVYIILVVLAVRSIGADEKLIRSADRFR